MHVRAQNILKVSAQIFLKPTLTFHKLLRVRNPSSKQLSELHRDESQQSATRRMNTHSYGAGLGSQLVAYLVAPSFERGIAPSFVKKSNLLTSALVRVQLTSRFSMSRVRTWMAPAVKQSAQWQLSLSQTAGNSDWPPSFHSTRSLRAELSRLT